MLAIWRYTMKTKSEEQAPKKCSKCEEVKLLDEFGEGKAYADGHQSWCKSCMKEYRKIYDKCFPEKSKTNRRKNDKPWILPWLQDACKRKNKVYKIYVKNPTIENQVKYKKLKNFISIY